MADQETLSDAPGAFNPAVHGLWKRFVDNAAIRHSEWLRARAAGEFVGTCTHCGDYLVPLAPLQVGDRWDYEAVCRNTIRESRVDGRRVVEGCEHSMAAPGGRLWRPKGNRFNRTGGA